MYKKFLYTFFSPDIFKIIFWMVSLLGVCPIFVGAIEPYLKCFHIYAFVVLVLDLFLEKRILNNQGRSVLVLFGACYAVTLLNNTNLLGFSGLSNFCYLLSALSLVYSYGKGSLKLERIGATIICIVISFANIIGIVMFFVKYHMYVTERGYIGMFPYENRLAGLFGNPNVLGMVCLGALSLCGILFVSTKNRIQKVYLGILLGVNFLTLLLSNSRTQIYSFILMCSVFAFMQKLKKQKDVRSVGISIIVSLFVAVIMFGGCKGIQQGISYIDIRYDYYLTHIDANNNADQSEENTGKENTDQEGDFTEEDKHQQTIMREETVGFNGRLDIWKMGSKLFVAKPLFGSGLDNHNYALSELGYEVIPIKGNMHNVYLEILVCCGLAGFSCLFIYLMIMLGNVFKFFKYNSGETWTIGAMMLAAVAAFMLDGLMDSTLIASFYPTAISFWYVTSMFANLMEQENMKSGHHRSELLGLWVKKMEIRLKKRG